MTRQQVRALLLSNNRAVERAMIALYHCQTLDEQHTSSTKESNGRGFNAFHAELGSYYARWCISGRRLTGYHIGKARDIALHYVGQLARMSQQRAVPARPTQVVVVVRSQSDLLDAVSYLDRFQRA